MLASEIIGSSAAATGSEVAAGSLYGGSGFGASALGEGAATNVFGGAAGAGADFGTSTLGSGMGAAPDYFSGLAANSTLGGAGASGASTFSPEWLQGAAIGQSPENAALLAQPDFAGQASKISALNQAAKNPMADPEFMKNPLAWMQANPVKTAMAGAGIYTLANVLKGGALTKPNTLPAYNPVTAQSMGLGRTLSSNYQRGVAHAEGGAIKGYADGGITGLSPSPNMMQTGPANVNFMGGDMYPQSQIHRSYYATPTQMPTSAQETMASYEPKTNPLTGQMTANMAAGGIADLGSYSDGGRMLKGPGDGMSDNIPATIGGKQPARLADGEFVVPADVVSHLGNGSTDAGAKQLYSMMNKVRQARTGTKKQGRQINPNKFLKA
jgi:hypothetical protein